MQGDLIEQQQGWIGNPKNSRKILVFGEKKLYSFFYFHITLQKFCFYVMTPAAGCAVAHEGRGGDLRESFTTR